MDFNGLSGRITLYFVIVSFHLEVHLVVCVHVFVEWIEIGFFFRILICCATVTLYENSTRTSIPSPDDCFAYVLVL